MGLIGKLSEMRMKDPVEGVLRVVGISMPDPTATEANYRLEGVVSADGLTPTAVTHHGMTSVGHWPSAGDELPVTVDRTKPERLVIHWKTVPNGFDQSRVAAQQLAEQMRSGTAPAARATSSGGGPSNVTVTVNGKPMDLGAAVGSGSVDLSSIIQSAMSTADAQDTSMPEPAPATASNADILARGTAGNATLLGTFPSPVP
ncbi:MAG TPA: hypothetical protein VHV76_05615, partial [Mycobacteriales bacterium]|nr:hypothetical protein [Mycobacteriales bacterium]